MMSAAGCRHTIKRLCAQLHDLAEHLAGAASTDTVVVGTLGRGLLDLEMSLKLMTRTTTEIQVARRPPRPIRTRTGAS